MKAVSDALGEPVESPAVSGFGFLGSLLQAVSRPASTNLSEATGPDQGRTPEPALAEQPKDTEPPNNLPNAGVGREALQLDLGEKSGAENDEEPEATPRPDSPRRKRTDLFWAVVTIQKWFREWSLRRKQKLADVASFAEVEAVRAREALRRRRKERRSTPPKDSEPSAQATPSPTADWMANLANFSSTN